MIYKVNVMMIVNDNSLTESLITDIVFHVSTLSYRSQAQISVLYMYDLAVENSWIEL